MSIGSDVHREFPRKFESSNLSRDNVREIVRIAFAWKALSDAQEPEVFLEGHRPLENTTLSSPRTHRTPDANLPEVFVTSEAHRAHRLLHRRRPALGAQLRGSVATPHGRARRSLADVCDCALRDWPEDGRVWSVPAAELGQVRGADGAGF